MQADSVQQLNHLTKKENQSKNKPPKRPACREFHFLSLYSENKKTLSRISMEIEWDKGKFHKFY